MYKCGRKEMKISSRILFQWTKWNRTWTKGNKDNYMKNKRWMLCCKKNSALPKSKNCKRSVWFVWVGIRHRLSPEIILEYLIQTGSSKDILIGTNGRNVIMDKVAVQRVGKTSDWHDEYKSMGKKFFLCHSWLLDEVTFATYEQSYYLTSVEGNGWFLWWLLDEVMFTSYETSYNLKNVEGNGQRRRRSSLLDIFSYVTLMIAHFLCSAAFKKGSLFTDFSPSHTLNEWSVWTSAGWGTREIRCARKECEKGHRTLPRKAKRGMDYGTFLPTSAHERCNPSKHPFSHDGNVKIDNYKFQPSSLMSGHITCPFPHIHNMHPFHIKRKFYLKRMHFLKSLDATWGELRWVAPQFFKDVPESWWRGP